MNRKYLFGLAPVVAVLAIMVAPALAQAQPSPAWFSNSAQIPVGIGNAVNASTSGELTLANANIGMVTCQVTDEGTLWNSGVSGRDEIEEFQNSNCVAFGCPGGIKVATVESTLPWPSQLYEPEMGVVRDHIWGIHVVVECPEHGIVLPFSGELHPKVVNGVEGVSNSFAEFDGANAGELESAAGPGTVTGNDTIEGPPLDEFISAE